MKYLLLISFTLAGIAGHGQAVGNPALAQVNPYVEDQWEQFIGGLTIIRELQSRIDLLEKKVDSLQKRTIWDLITPGKDLSKPIWLYPSHFYVQTIDTL